ncbi:MAG: hypothetical protein RLZZ127_724 [Planctomycetota bacterium]|jgi:serine/threonine protein kinase
MSGDDRTIVQDLGSAPPPPPATVGGFVLGRVLGTGGMGQVLVGEHPSLGRAAVKVLTPAAGADPAFLARFERECSVLERLDHPNIARLIARGSEDGRPWLAMELIDGPSLAELIQAHGQLSEGDALRMTLQIVRALDHAWKAGGLVHRDIKPGNVLVADGRIAKVIDFGLARDGGNGSDLTVAGAVVGTPAFMAPEQIRGERVDQRTDLYALGCALFQLLTGRPPYTDEQPLRILHRHLEDPVPDIRQWLPGCSAGTRQILASCLAKVPGARFADHGACLRAVQRAIAALGEPEETGLHLQVRRESDMVRRPATTRRHVTTKELRPQTESRRMSALEPRQGDSQGLGSEALMRMATERMQRLRQPRRRIPRWWWIALGGLVGANILLVLALVLGRS